MALNCQYAPWSLDYSASPLWIHYDENALLVWLVVEQRNVCEVMRCSLCCSHSAWLTGWTSAVTIQCMSRNPLFGALLTTEPSHVRMHLLLAGATNTADPQGIAGSCDTKWQNINDCWIPASLFYRAPSSFALSGPALVTAVFPDPVCAIA